MSYPEILLSLACLLSLLFLHRTRWRRRSAPTNWPLFGMIPGFLCELHRFHDWATEVLRESGCTFQCQGPWFCGMDILVTCDPANVNHIFNINFANYPKGEEYLEIFDVFGDGIFNADGDSWKSQRRAAQAIMADSRFRRALARTVRRKAENGLVPLLSRVAMQGSIVDLQDAFLRFTFDTTCAMVLGVDPGCLSPGLPFVPFSTAMDDVEEVIFFRHTVPRSLWKLLRRLRLGEEKKMAHAQETIDDFIANQISRKKEELSKVSEEDKGGVDEEDKAGDLLTSYLVQRPDVGDADVESKKFLRDTTLNLMLAGRDANAATLTWVCWLVSQRPAVEQKILDELTSIMHNMPECRRRKPVVFDNEDLNSAVYLEAAIHETLRLYPPIPFEHKGVAKPDVLPSGHRVGPKKKILFFMYSMARIEGVWGNDCCEFRPERWISEGGKLKHEPSYKFFSFSSGPRSCLGREMALTQMRVAAAAAIYNFRFKVVDGHVVTPRHSIVLYMRNGLMVRVESRGNYMP